ncbi:threonine-phosphate decarboxylase [Halomonas sp. ML-15]|uniref:threonine-phosphate decarboxylase CobD n=1 Tax=Halomonas sp. ML-15 TaxID=2773305 RepID=UPI001746B580|nr:threonine-phosphate decarboxylase CobD [Halomonas sp. ML-15]MBD3897608.1 threonine-phosphate decarboxylase [Halomonas sp. ML-15]
MTDATGRDAWPLHGGQPSAFAALAQRHGWPSERPLTDLSANLNPLGPPAWLESRLRDTLPALALYPDPDYPAARRAMAEAEGLAPEQVLLTNGGAEAIFLAAALHAGKRGVVVEPTFGEYARACRHYAVDLARLTLTGPDFSLDIEAAGAAMRSADVLWLCRPNNPTGTLVPRAEIEALAELGQRHATTLVVDEAFVDFTADDERLTPLLAAYPNLLLQRSLTKFFTLPGLRLGALLGSAEQISRAADCQLPWSVNALAAELVAPLLAGHEHQRRTQAWLDAERPYLQSGVARLGFEAPPTQANFLLLRDPRDPDSADPLFNHLLSHGLLARHTHNFAGLDGGWLRVALSERDTNRRLLEALAAWRER